MTLNLLCVLITGANADIRYRLLTDAAPSSGEFFQISPEDGTIILARSLDRETQSAHHVSVMAADRGNPSLSSTAHIWIQGDIFALCFSFFSHLRHALRARKGRTGA